MRPGILPGSVGELIVTAIERHGPRTAFIAGERRVTFHAFGQDVPRTVEALTGLGLQPGRRGAPTRRQQLRARGRYDRLLCRRLRLGHAALCWQLRGPPARAGGLPRRGHRGRRWSPCGAVREPWRRELEACAPLALGPGMHRLPPLCPQDGPGAPRPPGRGGPAAGHRASHLHRRHDGTPEGRDYAEQPIGVRLAASRGRAGIHFGDPAAGAVADLAWSRFVHHPRADQGRVGRHPGRVRRGRPSSMP